MWTMNLSDYNPVRRTPAEINVGTWKVEDAYAEWLWRAKHNYHIPSALTKAMVRHIEILFEAERSRDDRKQEWEKDQERVYRRLDKSQNRINALKKKVKTLEEKIAWIQGK